MVADAGLFAVELLLVAFAGGAIGVAIGGYAALSLAGLTIVFGEVGNYLVGAAPGDPAATGLTALVGYGPALGPHVAFAGAVAAAAYVGRRERPDSSFPYHSAKNVVEAIGVRSDAMLAGGAFGVLGYWIATVIQTAGLPVDPVMASVVVTGLLARVAFGYPILGRLPTDPLDMTPGGATESAEPAGDDDDWRSAVEPWAPAQCGWRRQAIVGFVVGLFAAYLARITGSHYLAFGLAAASLAFVVAGDDRVPVTHHAALPASIAALSVPAAGMGTALLLGAVFGIASGLVAELAGRLLYAHAETHVDPPAVAITVSTLGIGVLTTVGVLQQTIVPAV